MADPGLKMKRHQTGASLVTAVFLITALAVLGALLSRVMSTASIETVNEYTSAKALYAAESGIDYAAYQLVQNTGDVATSLTAASATNQSVDTDSWFTTTVTALVTPATTSQTVYAIRSTGSAGGSAANPTARRELVVHFKP